MVIAFEHVECTSKGSLTNDILYECILKIRTCVLFPFAGIMSNHAYQCKILKQRPNIDDAIVTRSTCLFNVLIHTTQKRFCHIGHVGFQWIKVLYGKGRGHYPSLWKVMQLKWGAFHRSYHLLCYPLLMKILIDSVEHVDSAMHCTNRSTLLVYFSFFSKNSSTYNEGAHRQDP